MILERAVLTGPVQVDDRPAPPAEACAEAVEAVARLAHGGCHLAIASHHPAVARGLLEMTTVNGQNRRLTRQLEEAGGRIDAIAVCPHAPDAGCGCRMPESGMLTNLITRFGVTTACTLLIAVSDEAVAAGLAAGCATWRILTPGDAGGAVPNVPDGVLIITGIADGAERLLSGRIDDPCSAREPGTLPVLPS